MQNPRLVPCEVWNPTAGRNFENVRNTFDLALCTGTMHAPPARARPMRSILLVCLPSVPDGWSISFACG